MRMEFFNQPFVSSKSEDDEYYRLKPGAFSGTSRLSSVPRGNHRLLTDKVLKSYVQVDELSCGTIVRHPVVFVERFEYANLYHTMTDYINVFLALQQNHLQPADIQLVLFDHHGEGALDSVWQDVYSPRRPVLRLESFRNTTRTGGVCFEHAIFALPGYDSPVYSKEWGTQSPCRSASLPVRFSRFFYQGYGLKPHHHEDPEAHKERPLELTLVLRNDYVAHPRNPTGHVVRKWHDNSQVIGVLEELCSSQFNCHVTPVDFAVMDFPSQMRQMSRTDILVGVHGAGLAHAMFLPKGGYLVEAGASYAIFQDFARWTGSQATLVQASLGTTVPPPQQLYVAIAEAARHILRWGKVGDLESNLEQHIAAVKERSPKR